MRGRKHPLEIFRDSGRSFVTRPGEMAAAAPPPPPADVKGAYLARAREATAERGARRAAAPANAPANAAPAAVARKPASPATDPDGSSTGERGAVETVPPRAWDAKAPPPLARRGPALLRLPLAKVGSAVAAGLVLLVGAAYALSLWPFAPSGEEGDGHPALKSTDSSSGFLSNWLKPHERDSVRKAAEEDSATPAELGDGAVPASEPAAASANLEFWVLAASENLDAATRKTWAQRCESDKQSLRKALGEGFPDLRVQSCTAGADGMVGLLRIGPASSKNDPMLASALAKVRALGGRFGQAYIKQFRKS